VRWAVDHPLRGRKLYRSSAALAGHEPAPNPGSFENSRSSSRPAGLAASSSGYTATADKIDVVMNCSGQPLPVGFFVCKCMLVRVAGCCYDRLTACSSREAHCCAYAPRCAVSNRTWDDPCAVRVGSSQWLSPKRPHACIAFRIRLRQTDWLRLCGHTAARSNLDERVLAQVDWNITHQRCPG
jgi:hypothetical protein